MPLNQASLWPFFPVSGTWFSGSQANSFIQSVTVAQGDLREVRAITAGIAVTAPAGWNSDLYTAADTTRIYRFWKICNDASDGNSFNLTHATSGLALSQIIMRNVRLSNPLDTPMVGNSSGSASTNISASSITTTQPTSLLLYSFVHTTTAANGITTGPSGMTFLGGSNGGGTAGYWHAMYYQILTGTVGVVATKTLVSTGSANPEAVSVAYAGNRLWVPDNRARIIRASNF